MTLPIMVGRNGSYNDLVASIIDIGDLNCEPNDVVISYLMNSREKAYFKNKGVERPLEEPLNSSPPLILHPLFDDDSVEYENKGDHPMNMEYHSMDMEYDPLDTKNIKEDCGLGSQPNHSFSDETNFYRE
ncbi:hypothetical protein BC332_07958 [Capsicum chinense]|nr:hypothetical protein BC332_07958 [Capsicum chinense]